MPFFLCHFCFTGHPVSTLHHCLQRIGTRALAGQLLMAVMNCCFVSYGASFIAMRCKGLWSAWLSAQSTGQPQASGKAARIGDGNCPRSVVLWLACIWPTRFVSIDVEGDWCTKRKPNVCEGYHSIPDTWKWTHLLYCRHLPGKAGNGWPSMP